MCPKMLPVAGMVRQCWRDHLHVASITAVGLLRGRKVLYGLEPVMDRRQDPEPRNLCSNAFHS